MEQFAMLISPSANRVYSRTAMRMMTSEITILNRFLMDCSIEQLEEVEIGGVPYLTFRVPSMSHRDLQCISHASSLFALFRQHGQMLEPIKLERLDQYDDDLVSILKYGGKTNEQFTKLLLNVTAAVALPSLKSSQVKVFDPMCGRGTTLNQAIMYGWDSYGVEIDKRDFEAYSAFIQRWLKNKSIKHKAVKSRVKREGKTLGQRLLVEFAASKELYKASQLQTLEMLRADTLHSGEIYKKRFFDLIVTDAPYGVQHAAVNNPQEQSRSPKKLLDSAIPRWTELLRPGGALGLSWNTYVLSRHDLETMLTGSGLEVMSNEPFLGFEHRVDQAINRDLIVARKPAVQ